MNEIAFITRTKHLTLEECKEFDFVAAVNDPGFHQIIKRKTVGENPVPVIAVQFVMHQPLPPTSES